MEKFLMVLGGIAFLVCTGVIVLSMFIFIVERIRKLRYRYIIKHRFDEPPTAKCYCMDCSHHDPGNKRCYKFDGWYTADNWFCWGAKPRNDI